MAGWSEFVTPAIFILAIVPIRSNQATSAGLNAKEYQILCNIYNVATAPPADLYDEQMVRQIRDEIDFINASLSDDSWFGGQGMEGGAQEGKVEIKSQSGLSGSEQERWKAALAKVNAKEPKYSRLPANEPTVRLAQAKLRTIEDQVKKIQKSLDETKEVIKLDQIKADFAAAIGESACEKDENCGVTGSRGTVCGTATGANSGGVGGPGRPGSNLIIDFMCLCAGHTRQSTNCGASTPACGQECLPSATSATNWYSSNVAGIKNFWGELKEGCKAFKTVGAASVAGAEAALNAFINAVKGAIESSGGKATKGRLGQCDGDCGLACDGDYNSRKGICVAYGQSGWENSVEWYKKIKNGITLLKIVESKAATVQHELAVLKMLQARAEQIYAETQAALELEQNHPKKATQNLSTNQSQKTNPTTSADKATAQEPNAVSISPTPPFILPWTFLI